MGSQIVPPPPYPSSFLKEERKKSKGKQSEVDRWQRAGEKLISEGKLASVAVFGGMSSGAVGEDLRRLIEKQAKGIFRIQSDVSQVPLCCYPELNTRSSFLLWGSLRVLILS